jgi:shikimate kinase
MTGFAGGGLPARIYLTGFMGSGKSTVAPLLAGLLGYECLDLDEGIADAAGLTVGEIFAGGGEAEFRRLESAALFETASRSSIVVAAGGGAIASEESLAFVRSAGVLVYLRVDFETLFGRLRTMRDRPLLRETVAGTGAEGDGALRETMRRLMTEREPFYRRADIVADPDPSGPGGTASRIAESLRGLAAREAGRVFI